jgi:hypothetical protein
MYQSVVCGGGRVFFVKRYQYVLSHCFILIEYDVDLYANVNILFVMNWSICVGLDMRYTS